MATEQPQHSPTQARDLASLETNNDFRELPLTVATRTNLTSLLMSVPDALGPNVRVFVTTDEATERLGNSELVAFFHVGTQITGHQGIVHGGLLATLLDECLCRCGFAALPHKVGVTAHLSIDYKQPTPANSNIVLKAQSKFPSEGRKAWVEGKVFVLDDAGKEHDHPTMEAKLLVVEPKWWEKLVPLN